MVLMAGSSEVLQLCVISFMNTSDQTSNPTSDSATPQGMNSLHYEQTGGVELLEDSTKGQLDTPPLLPRLAWKSELAYLKAIFRAKQAIDRAKMT